MQHLISIGNLTAASAQALLNRAAQLQQQPCNTLLQGRTQMQVFFENSTRTMASFELAGRRAGAHVITLPIASSSTAKGETLADTLAVLGTYAPDILVMRHSAAGAAYLASNLVSCAVINAGDGTHEHPTQALIDAFVLQQRFGRVAGLIVCIVGDVLHSRVARSNLLLLTLLGAKVRLVAPPVLLPPAGTFAEAEQFTCLTQATRGADAIMTLRLQHERMQGLSLHGVNYQQHYRVDAAIMANAAPHAVLLHPGPVNRDVEVCGILADDARCSLIRAQSAAGLPVRTAVLERAVQA